MASEQIHFYESTQPKLPVTQEPQKTAKDPFIHCRFCPCLFLNVSDMHKHYKAFGFQQQEHAIKWHDELKRREYF